MLKREKHFLDGATLHVSITQDNSTSPLTPLEDIQELRTIEVAGISLKTTEDSIRNFFENTRRSGGGDIENIELYAGKGVAVVTFLSAESKYFGLNLIMELDYSILTLWYRFQPTRVPFWK